MGLEEILEDVMKAVDGAIGVILGGSDGMAVSAVVTNQNVKVNEIAASVAMSLRNARKAANEIKSGEVKEMLIETVGGKFYVRPLNADYWMAVIMEPDANTGRAKLEMNKAVPKMLKEIS